VAILSIGFAGVIGLVGVSDQMLTNSINREALTRESNEILDTINSDIDNIMSYQGKNLKTCSALTTPAGKSHQLKRLKKWCSKVNGKSGIALANDKRKIHITKINASNQYVVIVELSNNNGSNSSYVQRVINVP